MTSATSEHEVGLERASIRRLLLPQAVVDRALVIALLAIAWEVFARLNVVNTAFLPAPSSVLAALPALARDEQVRTALLISVGEIALAFVIGGVIGVFLGVVLGVSAWAYRALMPVVGLLMSTPKSLFLPLLIVLIGTGQSSKVVYGVVSAVLYVAANAAGGVLDLDKRYISTARAFGASRRQLMFHVILPGALPGISTGLWLGLTHAFTGVLIAELFVSQGGIGSLIARYSALLQTERVLALTLVLAVVAIFMGTVWEHLKRRMDRWRLA
jgi:ABC-type nitrate/sulfonate/bicarbonate transport system permease component